MKPTTIQTKDVGQVRDVYRESSDHKSHLEDGIKKHIKFDMRLRE